MEILFRLLRRRIINNFREYESIIEFLLESLSKIYFSNILENILYISGNYLIVTNGSAIILRVKQPLDKGWIYISKIIIYTMNLIVTMAWLRWTSFIELKTTLLVIPNEFYYIDYINLIFGGW